jgi:DNA sulfur modification protein DndD
LILDELVLRNFGTFAGEQRLDLSLSEPNRPLILIGGLNGAGKTTLLEAVQLALYGQLAPTSTHRGLSYESYLRRSLHSSVHDSARSGGVELALRITADGREQRLRVIRQWRLDGLRLRHELRVERDGEIDPNLSADWPEYVEGIFPRGIAGLFFFDGEQIEALADLEGSRQVLDTAVSGLLGLDLVDRLITDLTVLERRRKSSSAGEEDRAHLMHLEKLLASRQEDLEETLRTLKDARRHYQIAVERLEQAEERHRQEGGDAFAAREKIVDEVAAARVRLGAAAAGLAELSAGLAPLLMVPSLLGRVAQQAATEQEAATNRSLVNVLRNRDQKLLRAVGRAGAPAEVLGRVTAFLEDDLQKRVADAAIPARLGLSDKSAHLAAALASTDLAEQAEAVRRGLRAYSQARRALDEAERRAATVPTVDALAATLAEVRQARDFRDEAARRLEDLEQMYRRGHDEYTATTRRLQTKVAEIKLALDDDERFLTHLDRVRATLGRLRDAATRRHAARIEALVLEALTILLRKRRLITSVKIDPDTLAVSLLDAHGRELAPSKLSAGERQLLAVALLWGLGTAAGRPLPVMIDTPLGRLDRYHRDRLVGKYLPAASHQVIVLATDGELDDATVASLAPCLSRVLHLAFDPDRGATEARPGWLTPVRELEDLR